LARLSSVDSIEDPTRLAHALLSLGGGASQEMDDYPPYVRASSIYNVCPRERVLGMRAGKVVPKRAAGVQLQTVYDMGHAFHEYMQNNPAYFGGKLYGWWVCSACQRTVFGTRHSGACQVCGAKPGSYRYKEHGFQIREPWRLSGHVDAYLEIARGDFRICDLKTINGKDFEKLTAPHIEHLYQVHAYLLGHRHHTLPVTVNQNAALLLYASKRMTTKTFPFKAFHVRLDPIIAAAVEDILSEFTRAVGDFAYNPAPRQDCLASNFMCYRATSCPCVAECREAM